MGFYQAGGSGEFNKVLSALAGTIYDRGYYISPMIPMIL